VNSTKIKRLNDSIKFMWGLRELWINDTRVRRLNLEIANLPNISKIVLNDEEQIENYQEMRRRLSQEKWMFVHS